MVGSSGIIKQEPFHQFLIKFIGISDLSFNTSNLPLLRLLILDEQQMTCLFLGIFHYVFELTRENQF